MAARAADAMAEEDAKPIHWRGAEFSDVAKSSIERGGFRKYKRP